MTYTLIKHPPLLHLAVRVTSKHYSGRSLIPVFIMLVLPYPFQSVILDNAFLNFRLKFFVRCLVKSLPSLLWTFPATRLTMLSGVILINLGPML